MKNGLNSLGSSMQDMFNPQALMHRIFRPVENVVWDLSTGLNGVMTSEGIVTIEGPDTDGAFQTVLNPISGFGMALPAFAQQTALDAVKPGDLMVYGTARHENTGWVTEAKGKSVSILRPNGTHTRITPPKTKMLDFGTGVMVVRTLINMLPGGQAGLTGLNGMLMPMMMSGIFSDEDGQSDLAQILPFMLMMQGAGTTTGAEGTDASDVNKANNIFGGMMGGGANGPMGGFMQMMMLQMQMKMIAKMMSGKNNGGGFMGMGGFGGRGGSKAIDFRE